MNRTVRWIAVRLLVAVFVLWAVVTASFFLMHAAPGGPFERARALTPSVQANLERHWGLDRPLAEQYVVSLSNLLQLDFGPSLQHMGRYEVRELLSAGVPVSLELGLLAMTFALALGALAGLWGAVRPRSVGARALTGVALSGLAVPCVVLAPLLLVVFSVWLGWLPSGGWEGWRARILPTVSLGLVYAASVSRLVRAGVDDVLGRLHVRAARARGIPEATVIRRHVLRGGLVPLVSWMGPALAGILTGSVAVERIFGIPGVAEHFVASAQARDYPLVLGVVVLYSAMLLLFNLLMDIVHGVMDPRVRHGVG